VGIAHVLNAEDEQHAEDEEPDIVWHYTNATGLLGILNYGCLWASNINFLNNVTENKKAKQLLHAHIKKRLSDPNDYERIAYPTPETQSKTFIRTNFVKLEYYNARLHDDVFDSLGDALITASFKQPHIEILVRMLVDDTAPKFKDTSFEEEHEWRLICRGDLDYMNVQYRAGRSHLVPYITVSLENISGVIREIMVGPGPNKELDVLA
jgi:hypothetical protein